MNRQSGMSSLLLVLMILALGSLALQGMSVQQQSLLAQTALEKRALAESADADSLLEWGRVTPWSVDQDSQCQQKRGLVGRVCLRHFIDNTVLLIANSGEQMRWQTGKWSEGTLQFDANGWSDFCPRKESAQCQLP